MAFPLILAGVAAAGAAAGAGAAGGVFDAGKNRRNSPGFTDPASNSGYDPNASRFGGDPEGLNRYNAELAARRAQADQRGAFQADYGRAGQWDEQSQYARGAQGNVAQAMWQRASGQVPSIAQAQADRQMQQATAAQSSAAASAQGPAALARAQRNAALNTAHAQSDISNQAQINAANERMQAEQAAFGAYSGMRQGDVASQAQAANQAQFQAGLQQANRNANDQRAMLQDQLQGQAMGQELAARTQEQSTLAQAHSGSENRNQATAQANAANTQHWWDTALNKIGSDVRAKVPYGQGIPSDFSGKTPFGSVGTGGGALQLGGMGTRPMSGPAQASMDKVGSGGEMDVLGSLKAHSDFGTKYQSDPTNGMAGFGLLSDMAAKGPMAKAPTLAGKARLGPSNDIEAEARRSMGRGPSPTTGNTGSTARFVPGRGWVQPGADEAAEQKEAFESALAVQAAKDAEEGAQDEQVRAMQTKDNDARAQWERSFGSADAAKADVQKNDNKAEAAKIRANLGTDKDQTPWWMAPAPGGLFGGESPATSTPAPTRGMNYDAFYSDFTAKDALPLYEPPGKQLHQGESGAFLADEPSEESGRARLSGPTPRYSKFAAPTAAPKAKAKGATGGPRRMTDDELMRAADKMEREMRGEHEARMAAGPSVRSSFLSDFTGKESLGLGDRAMRSASAGAVRGAAEGGKESLGDRATIELDLEDAKNKAELGEIQRMRQPKSFKRDTKADQRRVARDYDKKLIDDADAQMAAMRASLDQGPSVRVDRDDDGGSRYAMLSDERAKAEAYNLGRAHQMETHATGKPPEGGYEYGIPKTGIVDKSINPAKLPPKAEAKRDEKTPAKSGAAPSISVGKLDDPETLRRATGYALGPVATYAADRIARGLGPSAQAPAPVAPPQPPAPPPRTQPRTAAGAFFPKEGSQDSIVSDERGKFRLGPERGKVADANRTLLGSLYAYKPGMTPEGQNEGEPNFGPMAQNLLRNPLSATAVREDPEKGMLTIDRDKAIKLSLSAIADLQRQEDETRIALKRGGKGRRAA